MLLTGFILILSFSWVWFDKRLQRCKEDKESFHGAHGVLTIALCAWGISLLCPRELTLTISCHPKKWVTFPQTHNSLLLEPGDRQFQSSGVNQLKLCRYSSNITWMALGWEQELMDAERMQAGEGMC